MALVATSEFLISIADAKLHLGITTTDQDSWLDKAIASLTARTQTYCKRKFKKAQYIEFHSGDGQESFVYVDNPPITVSGTTEDMGELNDDVERDFGSSTAFGTNAYIVYNDEGRIELLTTADVVSTSILPATFTKGQQNIKIVYSGGYADIPEDIKMGVSEWIAKIYRRQTNKRWGMLSDSKGGVSISYESLGSMPDDVKEHLAPYRLFRFGRRK
tara:strand:- start:6109 stop:6756 length:648 start_codon:yes stop_codon:yes gene_type:complete